MDGRELLRRYLEQRRELGESEFVLDHLTVEDALKALGVRGGTASGPPAHRGPTAPAENPARSAAATAAEGGDWREALRAMGAGRGDAPPAAPPPGSAAAPAVPSQSPPAASDEGAPRVKVPRLDMPAPVPGAAIPHENAPPGLVVGTPMGELLPGPLAHLDSLEAIAQAVKACTQCGLYAGALNPVPGAGNPHAKFVCVGEAPGKTEDETGLPFVGAAGQLLTKILIAVNLRREDVFICNVLKHRPPGNRNPALDEVKACSPFLLRQLELLQPRVILALGTFAAQTLLQTSTPIGKLRGQVHRFYGVPLIVTYHPAALLRNPSWKRPTWEDVQLARRILDSSVHGT